MRVSTKSFDVNMEVKSNGIEFEVRSPDRKEFLGDCYVTMTGLIWCKGKTAKNNGVRISWNDFIALMSSDETARNAVKDAKAVSRS